MLCKSCGAKLNGAGAVCPKCHEDNRSSFELFCNNGELLLGILPGVFSGATLSEPLYSEGHRDGLRSSGLRGTGSSSGEKGAFIIRSPETEQRTTRTAPPGDRPGGRFKPLTPGKTGDLTSGILKAKPGKSWKSELGEAVPETLDEESGKSGEEAVSKLKVSRTLSRAGRYSHPEAPDDAGPAFPGGSPGKESRKTVYSGDLRPPEDSSGGFWPVFIMLSIVLAAGAGLLYYTDEGRKILYSYVLTEPHPIAKDLPPSREYSESPGNTGALNAGSHGRRSGRHSQKEQPSETTPASPEKPVIAAVPADSAPSAEKNNQTSGTVKTDKPDKPAEGAAHPVTAPRPIISVPAEKAPEKTETAAGSAASDTAGTTAENVSPVIAPRPVISIPAEISPEKTEIASSPAATDSTGASEETKPPVTAPRPIISAPPEADPEKTETAAGPQIPNTAENAAETASSVTAPRPVISTSAEVPAKQSGDLTSASPKTPENKDTAKADPKKTQASGSGASQASGRSAQKPAGSNAASGRKPAGSQPAKPGRKSDKPRGRNKTPRKNSRRK